MEEYCKKFFLLMDSPWVEMRDKYVSMNWLVKVRDRLGKVGKKQQKIKQREVFD